MTFDAFGLSDVGRRRDSNEDEFLVAPEVGLYAVADGMGGHAAGEVASRLAIETVEASIRGAHEDGPHVSARAATDALRAAVAAANRRICDSMEGHEERRGMGTTLAALLLRGDGAVIGHVGDSRVYLLRDGELHRMTHDHSWVMEQVRMGLLSDDAAQHHPMRNIVTRALGGRADVAVDIVLEPVRPGDLFVVCSDGLNSMLEDEAIREIAERHRDDPEACCRALIDAANRRGGEDNVTVVVVRVLEGR